LRRIAVVGNTAAGKTTLSQALAQRLGIPHLELDALYWGPGWDPVPVERFREAVAAAASGDAWVLDGNYSAVRDIVWRRADTLVWLDFSLPLVLVRLTRRQARRILTREELWNGNRDSLRDTFSRKSLFLWAWQSHRRRRRAYVAALAAPEHSHLSVLHVRTPRAARRWLATLST